MLTKSLELKHTIKLIQELSSEIDEIEFEIGVFHRFDSADKILAYAGISPSTYQSGQLDNCYAHMEKRGSRYLRYALYNATKYVCHWDESFGAYLTRKLCGSLFFQTSFHRYHNHSTATWEIKGNYIKYTKKITFYQWVCALY